MGKAYLPPTAATGLSHAKGPEGDPLWQVSQRGTVRYGTPCVLKSPLQHAQTRSNRILSPSINTRLTNTDGPDINREHHVLPSSFQLKSSSSPVPVVRGGSRPGLDHTRTTGNLHVQPPRLSSAMAEYISHQLAGFRLLCGITTTCQSSHVTCLMQHAGILAGGETATACACYCTLPYLRYCHLWQVLSESQFKWSLTLDD